MTRCIALTTFVKKGSLTIFAKESANIDSLLSKSLTINEKDNGQSILSSQNAKIVKDPKKKVGANNSDSNEHLKPY